MRALTLLFSVICILGCHNRDRPKGAEFLNKNKIKKKKIDESALATRLFENYVASPTVLGHTEENMIIDYAIENNLDLMRSPSGLYYMIIKHGAGKPLNKLETLKVDYLGTFLDGKIFDSSYNRGRPIVFKIGEMVAGWNEGLIYFKHGDEAVLIIPSRLGYGKVGFPNSVPPNKILRFDLKIY